MGYPILVDWDGDEVTEILMGSDHGALFCWEPQWNPTTSTFTLVLEKGWPIQLAESSGTPGVADLDGDGLLELVVPAEDGFIHAYDLPGASVAWAGAAYDWARTGFLPPAGARSPESAADLSSEADVAVVDGNPSQEAARDRFRQPVAGPAAAHIYDVSGRQVRVLLDAPQLAAGTHDIEWDGRDTAGEAVPAGVYFTRIRAGHHQMTQRVVKVR